MHCSPGSSHIPAPDSPTDCSFRNCHARTHRVVAQNLLMASPLLASAYCSPACLHSRTQLRSSVCDSVSGRLSLTALSALIKKRPTALSAFQNKTLAHPPTAFSMSRRMKSPVVAKVSQTESKTNSKQDGQPPDDNVYIAVTLCLTNMTLARTSCMCALPCEVDSIASNSASFLCMTANTILLQLCVSMMLVCKLRHIQYDQCPAQASVAAAMATGVANRVLYKMALVPMGNYVFVLSQFQTFGYLLVYFGILATRYRSAFSAVNMLTCLRLRTHIYTSASCIDRQKHPCWCS